MRVTWLQSFLTAFLAVATVIYAGRAVVLHRSGNPNATRWTWVAVLFAVAFAANLVALIVSA